MLIGPDGLLDVVDELLSLPKAVSQLGPVLAGCSSLGRHALRLFPNILIRILLVTVKLDLHIAVGGKGPCLGCGGTPTRRTRRGGRRGRD